ncbi:MAG TPA: hypothetical protein VIP70_05300 [Nitrososphaeraceae archaeon]
MTVTIIRKETYPTGSYKYSLGVRHSPSYPNNNKRYWDRIEGPTWTALDKCWLGYVIAKNKEQDENKMRLYAKRIQKLQRELEIEVSEFPELGLYAIDQCDPIHNNGEDGIEDDDEDIPGEDPFDNSKECNPTGTRL